MFLLSVGNTESRYCFFEPVGKCELVNPIKYDSLDEPVTMTQDTCCQVNNGLFWGVTGGPCDSCPSDNYKGMENPTGEF